MASFKKLRCDLYSGVSINPIEQYNNGIEYYVEKNYTKSIEAFKQASDQGLLDASFNVAMMYIDGLGIGQSYSEALKYLLIGAEKNDSKSQYNLGVMYKNGLGVTKNLATAAKWFKKADQNGLTHKPINGVVDTSLMHKKPAAVPSFDDFEDDIPF